MARPGRYPLVTPTADQEGSGPWRRCLVDGVTKPAETMIRFVVSPDGVVVPDVAGRLPGRGFWLSARRDAVKTACAKKLFAKAARAPGAVAPDLDGEIERLLARRCLDLIGMARRAGQAAVGFEKVKGFLRSRRGPEVVLAGRRRRGGRTGGKRLRAGAGRGRRRALFRRGTGCGPWVANTPCMRVVAPGRIADKLLARRRGWRGSLAGDRRAGRDKVCNTGPDGNANGLR
jgi:predicted RNA-binding protein YlxR (DUF448 family)